VFPHPWEFLHTSAFIPFSFLYSFSEQTIALILLRLVLLLVGVAVSRIEALFSLGRWQKRAPNGHENQSKAFPFFQQRFFFFLWPSSVAGFGCWSRIGRLFQ
jgi:hypothetical protein